MYSLQFDKSTTLAATLNIGANSSTLTAGSFGSPSGSQLLVVDYDNANSEVIKCTIAGTAISSVTRGLDGTSEVNHAIGAKIAMMFVPSHYSLLTSVVNDGWLDPLETWTYASATTITVPAGATSRYSVGDKIKLTQTTVKYFYVTAVADTLLTVTGGTDYTVANAAITANYYSKASSPVGFPNWFAYTPTLTGSGGSAGSVAASPYVGRFRISDKHCFIKNEIQITNGGSWSGDLRVTLPVKQASNATNDEFLAGWYCSQGSNPATQSKGIPNLAGANSTFYNISTGVNTAAFQWSATSANDCIRVGGSYEI